MPDETPRVLTMFEQLLGASASAARDKAAATRPAWPLNPFPPGIRPGSATAKVKAALEAAHPRWMEHHELMRTTGYSRGAVTWGLRYLSEQGGVRSIPSARHQKYRRYQIIKETT